MLGRASIFAAAVMLAAFCGAQNANAQGVFTLSSTSFKDGDRLPTKHAGNLKANPNCVGESISPAFSWTNVPGGTKSFAFVVFDPDGRPPGGFVHWVAYGIAASVTGFAEGEVAQASDKYVGGMSGFKLPGYMGPCPPPNTLHHYVFTVIATDLEPTALQPGLTRDDLIKALDGHVKGGASLIGIFSKP